MQSHESIGKILRVFRPQRWWIGLAICAVALGVIIPYILHVKSINNKDPNVGPLAAVAAVVAGVATYFVIGFVMSVNRRIYIGENGIIVQGLRSRRQLLWDEIEAVYHHVFRLVLGNRAWILTRDGRKVILPSTAIGLFTAVDLVCQGIEPRITSEGRASLEAGQTIPFGEQLELSRAGLLWQGQLLTWESLKLLSHAVENHVPGNMLAVRSILSVERSGGDRKVRTFFVPNIPILLRVVESDFAVKVERSVQFK